MDEKKILGGLAIVAIVLLGVALFGPKDRGPSTKDQIAEQVEPLSEAVAALDERIGTIEGSLGALSEEIAAADSSEALSELSARVDAAVAETAALGEDVAGVRSALDETNASVAAAAAQSAAAVAAAAAAAAVQDEAETPTARAAPAPAEEGGQPGLMPGQTALFADGAFRVFVSRLDPADDAVRVSVAGDLIELGEGHGRTFPVGDDHCRVTVSSVTSNGALMDAICGDDLPAPEGISVGNTAVLADGALRVFASLVGDETARLSVAGTLHTLALGQSVSTMAGEEPCRVYLDALDRGHAVVSAKCGAGMAVSDAAGAGSTVLLNEGAVRVFVSSVRDGAVRFAVNGQTLVSGGPDDSVALGDGCAVMVEDVADGTASFSHLCDD